MKLGMIFVQIYRHFRIFYNRNFSQYSLLMYFAIFGGAEKTFWPLFLDTVQLPQDCSATTKRQFTFHYFIPGNPFTHLIDHEMMKGLVNLVVLNFKPINLEFGNLTTRILLHNHGGTILATHFFQIFEIIKVSPM